MHCFVDWAEALSTENIVWEALLASKVKQSEATNQNPKCEKGLNAGKMLGSTTGSKNKKQNNQKYEKEKIEASALISMEKSACLAFSSFLLSFSELPGKHITRANWELTSNF